MYSKLALSFSLFTLVICIIMFNQIPIKTRINDVMFPVSQTLVCLFRISCTIGILLSVVSIVKKEEWKFSKIISVILNSLFLLLILWPLFLTFN
jgi:hypothetical protein